MRRILLPLLPVLLLACRPPTPPPITGTPPTPENLLATIDLTPRPLDAPSYAALGGTDLSIQGPVNSSFRIGDPVYATPDGTGPVWGQINGLQQALVHLAPQPTAPRESILGLIRRFVPASLCALDTLAASVETGAVTPQFYARTPGTFAAGVQPQTSPIPNYLPLYPALVVDEATRSVQTGILVRVDQDVKVQGELRCVFSSVLFVEDATQYALSVNVELKAGWNVLRESLVTTRRARGQSLQMVIAGAAQDYNTVVQIGEEDYEDSALKE